MYKLKPIIFENSIVPVLLSKLSPMEIQAVSFACFVWCRGDASDTLKRHETIHFYQQLEMLFVLQWVVYAAFYVYGRFKHGSWHEGYFLNPFEQEAYQNQANANYFKERRFWAWTRYIKRG